VYLVQDASPAEAKAALSVFGDVTILMCWFHMLYNVKKHKSLDDVNKDLKTMIILDLTRLHYCLAYEYENFKQIVFNKWKEYRELDEFVKYVIPQWFEGTFSNWQIFKSPPGFATTNNPLESFNKIIKQHFTNYDSKVILSFISVIMKNLIPFYSELEREFLFYRIPHSRTKSIANTLDIDKFQMRSITEASYTGKTHTHSINFQYKSCSCRWFLAFAICAHLIAACDIFKQPLEGYSKPRVFVYRTRSGRKKETLKFSEKAFQDSPMPVIPIPVVECNRLNLFTKEVNNLPSYPQLTNTVVETTRILRNLPKLNKDGSVSKKRGRPPKNTPALCT